MKKSLLLLAMLAATQAHAASAQEGVWQVSKGKPFPGYNYWVEDNSGKEEVSLTLTLRPQRNRRAHCEGGLYPVRPLWQQGIRVDY